MNLKALDGSAVVFPRSGSTKPILIMLGFSNKSDKDFKEWNRLLSSAQLAPGQFDFYELADLSAVPSFVRFFILHGMRRTNKGPEQSRFAAFYEDAKQWTTLAGYSKPEYAYVVITDPRGKVTWRDNGPANQAKIAALQEALTKLGVRRE